MHTGARAQMHRGCYSDLYDLLVLICRHGTLECTHRPSGRLGRLSKMHYSTRRDSANEIRNTKSRPAETLSQHRRTPARPWSRESPHLTTATLRETGEGVTTDEEQRIEAIAIAMAYIKKLEKLTVDGTDYHILFYDSGVYHAFDDENPIRVHKQASNPQANFDTTMDRPLSGYLRIPELLWRPFDCHEDSLCEYQEQCVL